MLPAILLQRLMPALIPLHQGDAADPELIHWLKDRMDEIIGLGPWAMVGLLAGLVVAVPVGVGLFYYWQQRRAGTP